MHPVPSRKRSPTLFLSVSVEILGIGSDVEDAHFMWKVETWLRVSVQMVAIGSEVKDAHFTWKVETWLSVSVEIVGTWPRRQSCKFHVES